MKKTATRRGYLYAVFKTAGIAALTLMFSLPALAQAPNFLQKMRFGFGGGVNFSSVMSTGQYELYEDLSGDNPRNEYSPMFRNFGYQYFFMAEYSTGNLSFILRPGTYSYAFSRQNTLTFNGQEVTEVNTFALKYFSVPMDVNYFIDFQEVSPFVGGTVAWSTLLGGGDAGATGFITTRIYLGPHAGVYYDMGILTLMASVGYNIGLHNITSKASRFDSGTTVPYSQDDLMLNNFYTHVGILFSLDKSRRSSTLKCKY